jgi:hypothetical protein
MLHTTKPVNHGSENQTTRIIHNEDPLSRMHVPKTHHLSQAIRTKVPDTMRVASEPVLAYIEDRRIDESDIL